MEFLTEPLEHALLVRGLIGGLIASGTCAALSAFVVWRGLALMGDAIAHSILPGIVIAYAMQINLFVGASVSAALAVIGIGYLGRKGRLKEDVSIGVVFSGFFATGLLLMSRVATFQDLSHILFGNLLGISRVDLILMASVAAIVIAGVILFFKEILTASFDPAHAMSIGLSPSLVRFIVLGLLGMATVTSVQTVGVVLVISLLVTPGAAASMLCRRLSSIIALSVGLGLTATIAGFYVSYYADVPSGPAIVIVLSIFFILCMIKSGKNR